MNEGLMNEAMPRRVMTLFLLIDSSGSMSMNGNMAKVNGAIEEMIPLLEEVSNENADAEIKVAVLSFSSGCKWITNGAETLENFTWNDLVPGGLTEMGKAFIELEKKMSRDEFLANSTGAFAPVVILLTDGQPTDDWNAGLEVLKHNNWYKAATKIAIGVDEEGTKQEVVNILSAFTGNTEAVLKVRGDRNVLKKLLCNLAVVSSKIVSRSVNVGEDDKSSKDNIPEIIGGSLIDIEEGGDIETGGGNNPWDTDVW